MFILRPIEISLRGGLPRVLHLRFEDPAFQLVLDVQSGLIGGLPLFLLISFINRLILQILVLGFVFGREVVLLGAEKDIVLFRDYGAIELQLFLIVNLFAVGEVGSLLVKLDVTYLVIEVDFRLAEGDGLELLLLFGNELGLLVPQLEMAVSQVLHQALKMRCKYF